ncbi:MAG: hypothetical protein RIQ54_323 [Candidatus Parcubacteria bacterium]|jgi:hypothetical protein
MTAQQPQATQRITPSATDQSTLNATLVHDDLPKCFLAYLNVSGTMAHALNVQTNAMRALERGEHVLKIMHDIIKALVEKTKCQGGTWYKVVGDKIVRQCMVNTGSTDDAWEKARAQTADLPIDDNSIIGYVLNKIRKQDASGEIIHFANLALWSGRLDDCPDQATGKIKHMRASGLLMHSSCIVVVLDGDRIKHALQLFRNATTREDLERIGENLFLKEDHELIIELLATVYLSLVLLEHMQTTESSANQKQKNRIAITNESSIEDRHEKACMTSDDVMAAMHLGTSMYVAAQKEDVNQFFTLLKKLVESFQK